MTAQESQAIAVLTAMVQAVDDTNREAHSQVIESIKELKREIALNLEAITIHCAERQKQVDNQLAERKLLFEAEIESARQRAVDEVRAPSVYRQATAGLARFTLRVLAALAALSAVISVTLVILEKTGAL
jgi:hypothetical protein